MTKFVKMSLAAAVAVAGISTTASAMENTSFSGMLYTEHYTKTASSTAPSVTGWEIDFTLTGKTKINDMLTMVTSIEADQDQDDSNAANGATLELDNAYFAYANAGVAVKYGRQYIDTPTTDGEVGEGVLATYTTGAITAAAAYFPSNNVVAGSDVTAVALLGTAGPVNFQAWSIGVATHSTSNTLVVGGSFSGVNAEVRSATTSYDAAGTKDGSTLKAVVSGKVSNVSLTGIYLANDKDGAALTTDPSSANTAELVYLVAKNVADLDLVAGVVSAPVGEKNTVIAKYGVADIGTNTEASELVLQVNHKLAKSTTASVRYADYSVDVGGTTTDKTHARLDVTYKF